MGKKKPFDQPRVAINRVYTRRGDQGKTSLVGGTRISKHDARLDAYGTVDELNSLVGLTRTIVQEQLDHYPALAPLLDSLLRVQHELFNLGAILATPEQQVSPSQARVTAEESEVLEQEIDRCNESLPPLRSFVLPGGSRLSAWLHVCRTVARRAERLSVALAQQESVEADSLRYLNRLSDAFFVWSRWSDLVQGCEETLWNPNLAASSKLPQREK